ncbi:type II toxin-antitoxin system HipA family toxin [Methylorubrum sp. POS3]|uniref:type II toxin-antitoxin system HipA family toxin n=1 Tax=Methylorubrum sp. POS3 TaxID=2998492 RepID=UPI00372756A2
MSSLVLEIYIDGFVDLIGYLVRDENLNCSFIYSEEYYSYGTTPISLALPLSSEPYPDQVTRNFFSNLLQENDQLQTVIDREGLERNDVVGILYHLGADCPGAISCLPAGSGPLKVPGLLREDYEPLSVTILSEIVNRLADRDPLPTVLRDPSPIAGVQRKIAITVLPNGQYALPKEGRQVPTTHILKVPRRNQAREARLEFALALMAARCGMPTAIPEVVEIDGVTGILIERFDRFIDQDGYIHRLHQEDFAQALGLPATMKYEKYGSADRCYKSKNISRLLSKTSDPIVSTFLFIRSAIFNLVVGNTDNHAKNYALLYTGGRSPSLAPFYDMVPTKLDRTVSHELSFSIGKAKLFEEINKEDVEIFLGEFGLSGARLKRFLQSEVVDLLNNIDILSENLIRGGLKELHDLIGGNLMRINEVMQLGLDIKVKDFYDNSGGGWSMGS